MDDTITELETRPLAVPPPSLDDISRPFAGDLLQRKALAQRLTNYIDRLACGAVLAIDAPWGEGKSWFARHWCADLEKAGYRVGMIDAFQQDYVEDPFLLLAGEIREVCQEDKHLANRIADKAAAVAGAILPAGLKLALNAGGKWLLGTTDVVDQVRDAADAAVEKSAEFVQEWAKQKLEAYAAEKETVRSFRAEVQMFAAVKDKPVVIFVDELDRCRPEFAVRLIERTKHFFDVPNLVFVLVMNRAQLENAICGVYGPKTDAAAYLGKFLNLSLSLPKSRNSDVSPEAMMTKYVKATLKRYGEDQSPGWFGATLPASAQLFDLSLRDIERACALRFLSDMECDGLLACLMESEGVTCSAGVPTIWLGLAQHMEAKGVKPTTMLRSVVGGSAMPQSLIRDFDQKFGVEVRHCWGMTETSPLGTQGAPLGKHAALAVDQQYALRSKQGRTVFGVQLKVVDANGQELPRDGQSAGELMVRGPWIVSEYFKGEKPALQGGWFPTGDIATIDADGIMQITDRVKDVIKSGGEWISSIDLENAAMGHPALAMAAVIGVKHPRWDERPVLCAVKKPGQEVDKAAVLDFLGDKVARWWLPDEVIFVDSLPMGATGKVQKMDLRQKYADVLVSG